MVRASSLPRLPSPYNIRHHEDHMQRLVRPRSAALLLTVCSAVALSACKDTRVKSLSKGISRDSVLAILGTTKSDTPYVYHESTYIVGGHSLYLLDYDEQ